MDKMLEAFDKWANEKGIGSHIEDRKPWLECFLAGWNKATEAIKEIIKEE